MNRFFILWLGDWYKITLDQLHAWSKQKILNLAIFNAILTLLLLLRSAGYFSPFLPLTINFIVILCLLLSVFLLGARHRTLFIIALLLWLFAAFLKIVGVDIWAERAAIYSFESLAIGIILLIWGSSLSKRDNPHD